MAQAPGGPTDPSQPPAAAYNPHYSQQQYPPQQQPPNSPPGYPPQNGYYPDPNKPAGFAAAHLPDRNDSTSPLSQFTDNRQSMQQPPPTSPSTTINSSWQQQQQQQPGAYGAPPQQNIVGANGNGAPNTVPANVHEAGGNVVGERDYNSNHHGQFHELG